MIDEYLLNHPSYKYAVDVMEGNVIAGNYIKKECKRFLDELNNEDSNYFFDVDLLKKIDGITKLINLADGIYAGASTYETLGGFQWYFIANVMCWKYKNNPEKRKYETSIMLIGRKNGKTFLTGLMFIIFMMIEPENSRFFSVSATKDLSSLIKEQMEMLLDKSPAVSKHFKWVRSEVRFLLKKSTMKPLAYSEDKLDGRKAAVWLADETAALPSRYPLDSMASSQLSQLNRTGIIISTAYHTTENPMTEEVDYAEKVLDGIIDDDKVFALIYKPDNPKEWHTDEAMYQANPILYSVPENYEILDDERKKSDDMPSKKSNYLTKHLNIFVDGDVNENYVNIDDMQKNKIDEFDWRGKEVYIGVDLAETIDNTAVSMVHYDPSTEKFYTKSWSFIPEDRANEKTRTERIDYFRMRDNGWCYFTGDRTIDQRFVEDFVLEIESRYGVVIKGIGYDRRNANSSKRRWEDEGNYECIEVRQHDSALGTPFKLMRDKILEGDFHYENNELLEINFKNAKQLVNTNMGIYVTKKKSTGKVDMVFSTVDAVYLWNRDIEEGFLHGAYEDRGIIIL